MTPSLSAIRCPNCSNPIQARIVQLIDIGQDPSAKARFLSGSLNLIQCNVCGYQGQIAAPLVYHDPDKELLLTYIPVEIGMPKDEQERVLGQLINQAINALEPEKRKGYLFQPQAVLTAQGLIERILQADGITKEEIEAQREKMRLFEEFLLTPEENVPLFVSQHDEQLDAEFFQIASLSLQLTKDEKAREAANQRIQTVLVQTSFGKDLLARETEIRAAAETLQKAGDKLTQEVLSDMLIDAPNEDRLIALIQLTRPALDYTFFAKFTERIEASQGEKKQSLLQLRAKILEQVEEIDKAQEARAAEAASLIQHLLKADDMEKAVKEALPMIDELFLGILHANLRAAKERKDESTAARLRELDDRIRKVIRESLPPSLQLAQKVLDMEDLAQAQAELENSKDFIDEALLNALMSTEQRLERSGNKEGSERIRQLYRTALRLSMKAKKEKLE